MNEEANMQEASMAEVGETVRVRLYDQCNKVVEGVIHSIDPGSHGSKGKIQIPEYNEPVLCGYHPEGGWYTIKD